METGNDGSFCHYEAGVINVLEATQSGQSVIHMLRVNSGIFGQTANFGQRPCLFHISNIGIKIKSTKQIVKILLRRLIRSRLI